MKDPSGVAMEASGTLESLAAGIFRKFETDKEGMHRFEEGKTTVRLQGDVFNLTNRLNSGLFSGTAQGAGRSFSIRLNGAF